jgi:hypothetical protein
MKRILDRAFLAFALLLSMSAASAQDKNGAGGAYNTGIGLRGGWQPGFTVKHFIKENAAVEGILHTRYKYRGWVLTGLYEKHARAFDVERLRWFYGLGAHAGHFRDGWYKNRWGNYYERDIITIGIDGILGLEYHIGDIPFTVGIDIKPFFDIINPGYGYWDAAFSVRYTF